LSELNTALKTVLGSNLSFVYNTSLPAVLGSIYLPQFITRLKQYWIQFSLLHLLQG